MHRPPRRGGGGGNTGHAGNIPRSRVKEYDFFGLRHYAGAHMPPAADMFLAFVNAAGVWVLCERIIVDRLIRRKPTKDDKLR